MSKTTKFNGENITWFYEQPIDIKFEMVMNHFEMSRIMINQIFEEIIREKTGERYEHAGSGPKAYYRHGFNPGSIKMGEHRYRFKFLELESRQAENVFHCRS
ncbi:MAG: hypothetical protein U0X76_06275 [Bacteroidia bacterium]